MPANPETNFRGGSPNGAAPEIDEEDHYAFLGVPFSATHNEITAAYRRAMKRTHPDRARPERRAAAEEHARRLNAAYAVLSNSVKRQAYDRTIRQQVIQDQIMRRYVGGFDTFGDAARAHARREPTASERWERLQAERQASLTLVIVAVGLTALILVSLVFGSFLASLVDALR